MLSIAWALRAPFGFVHHWGCAWAGSKALSEAIAGFLEPDLALCEADLVAGQRDELGGIAGVCAHPSGRAVVVGAVCAALGARVVVGGGGVAADRVLGVEHNVFSAGSACNLVEPRSLRSAAVAGGVDVRGAWAGRALVGGV